MNTASMTDPMLDFLDFMCCSSYTLLESIEFYRRGKRNPPTAVPSTLQFIKYLHQSNTQNTMPERIADFPKNESVSISKKVQFSTKIDVRIHEGYDEADASKLFYSEQDCRAMHKANEQAVIDVRMRLSTEDLEGFDCFLTGIENLLTPEIMNTIMADMKQCRQAVLKEQMVQFHSGEYDPDKLAIVSRYHSMWAAKRARKIGRYQSNR